MGKIRLVLPFLLWPFLGIAQPSNADLEGRIVDSANQEPVQGALVQLRETSYRAVSDDSGWFKIPDVPAGNYLLTVESLGYKTYRDSIVHKGKQPLSITLKADSITLEEVEIVSNRLSNMETPGQYRMARKDIEQTEGPIEDPMASIRTLPGVGQGGSLFSRTPIYIRGGSPDENMFLMDNVEIFWPWYFGGQKSMFNSQTIEEIELLTGGFPAKYGNYMSSVMNVSLREGSYKEFGGNVSLGIYQSQLLAEGPIKKDKASFMISARSTYMDVILGNTPQFPFPSLKDGTFKLSYKPAENHQLSLSGMASYEKVDFQSDEADPGVPNTIQTHSHKNLQSLQWQYKAGNMHNKLSLTHNYSNDWFEIGNSSDMHIKGNSYGLREDFTFIFDNRDKLKAGGIVSHNKLTQEGRQQRGLSNIQADTSVERDEQFEINSTNTRYGLYTLYEGHLSSKLNYNGGLRWDHNQHAHTFSPRLQLNYNIYQDIDLKAASGYYYQFASPAAYTQKKDLKANLAIHYTTGWQQQINDTYRYWVEFYYKDYQNLIQRDYRGRFTNTGYGFSRGAEVFFRKDAGKIKGWISYALGQSKRTFNGQDELVRFDYDQRHMINAVLNWHIDHEKKYVPALVHLRFRYEDGRPYTPVHRAVNTQSGWYPIRGNINSRRNPDFHNLNLRIEWHSTYEHGIKVQSYVMLYNLYNHKNLIGRNYFYGDNYKNNVNAQPYYATPFLPGGGFRMEF